MIGVLEVRVISIFYFSIGLFVVARDSNSIVRASICSVRILIVCLRSYKLLYSVM